MKILITMMCLIFVTTNIQAIELFEDNTGFLTGFVNNEASAVVTSNDTHFGTRAIRVTCPVDSVAGQIYNEQVPGWQYKVVANPQAANEVRWIMWAWKKVGPDGIMLQFKASTGWGLEGQTEVVPPSPVYRYFGGTNFAGWSGVRTSWHAPGGWQLVIRDLYADFGAFTMQGIAFTPYNGVGLFDSIYVAQTYGELIGAFNSPNTVVRVEAPTKVNDGEYFNVDITITNASNVSGFGMTIHYNHDIIRAKSVIEGAFLKSKSPTYWLEPDIDNSDNLIHDIVCVRTVPGGVSGSGTLLTVSFRADDEGESSITLEDVAISDAEGQLFPVAIENAVVLVDDFPAWDVTGDGKVDVLDFVFVGQNFGKTIAVNTEPNPDVNRNGVVDMADLILLASHYGEVYWDAAPGIEIVPLSAKPVLTDMLRYVLAADKPDKHTVTVLETLIDSSGRHMVSSWGSIKTAGR